MWGLDVGRTLQNKANISIEPRYLDLLMNGCGVVHLLWMSVDEIETLTAH